jgi:Mrp family chromosome partitioning ATPase
MTKIYEALENAGKERVNVDSPAGTPGIPRSAGKAPRMAEEKFLGLYQRIESLLQLPSGKIVLFAGAQPGEDNSRVAREFARTAATRLSRNVLLLAAGPHQPTLKGFPAGTRLGWGEAMREGRSVDDAISQISGSTLWVGQISTSVVSLPEILASPQAAQFADTLRSRFDMVVIDGPALGSTWDPMLLSEVVDGILLIVEAEKTRWQAIRYGMDQFGNNQEKILGVVFSKQRHYIPGFIYRKML